jgi:chlorobactene glucosyltransferase
MVYGRELYSCRMYKSLEEIWNGWTKNLFAGIHYNVGLVLVICAVLFSINIFPFLVLAGRGVQVALGEAPVGDPMLAMAGANVLLCYLSYVGGLKVADYSIKYFWSFPLGMMVTIGLFANSARRIALGKGVSWKGRTYTHTGEGQR